MEKEGENESGKPLNNFAAKKKTVADQRALARPVPISPFLFGVELEKRKALAEKKNKKKEKLEIKTNKNIFQNAEEMGWGVRTRK